MFFRFPPSPPDGVCPMGEETGYSFSSSSGVGVLTGALMGVGGSPGDDGRRLLGGFCTGLEFEFPSGSGFTCREERRGGCLP